MALITLEDIGSSTPKPQKLTTPATIITPCDPWPPPYYLENGLRKVHPYHFTYNTYCKERWRDRELIDIFATEFRDRPQQYYVSHHLHLEFNIFADWDRLERRHRKWKSCYQRCSIVYSHDSCEEWRYYHPHYTQAWTSCNGQAHRHCSWGWWYHSHQ